MISWWHFCNIVSWLKYYFAISTIIFQLSIVVSAVPVWISALFSKSDPIDFNKCETFKKNQHILFVPHRCAFERKKNGSINPEAPELHGHCIQTLAGTHCSAAHAIKLSPCQGPKQLGPVVLGTWVQRQSFLFNKDLSLVMKLWENSEKYYIFTGKLKGERERKHKREGAIRSLRVS